MFSRARIITITLVLAFLLGLQACAQKLSPQESCNFVVNSQQQRISWANRAPVTLYIDSSVPSQFYSSIQNAADDWNRQLGRVVLRIGGVTSNTNQSASDRANTIHWSNSWEPERAWEQARTTVAWVNDEILDADVKINALNYHYSSADQAIGGYLDFESLIVHEFGHVLGLSHVDRADSVMQPSLALASLRRTPGDIDITSAQCEY